MSLERAAALTRKTLAWFPVRVWRHFLQHNGFLLAASISYQSIFAIFAAVYFAFAGVGLWLGGKPSAVTVMIAVVNSYIPGLIGDHGLIRDADVAQVASASTGVLALTGAIAFVVAMWTAIGFVTFARRAVRDIFGLPFDHRNYVILKSRDLLAGALFGLALIIGALLAWVTSGVLGLVFNAIGWDDRSLLLEVLSRLASLVVGFALNTAAIYGLIRFLTGTSLPKRAIWPGSLLGGAALTVLQIGAGLLLFYTPSNPLLATFSVFIGFLLWFRLAGVVILVAASWVAVSATDARIPLVEQPAGA